MRLWLSLVLLAFTLSAKAADKISDAELRGEYELQTQMSEIYEAMTADWFKGRALLVRAVSREVCPEAKDVFAWIDEKITKNQRDILTKYRGVEGAKRELSLGAIMTRVSGHPEIAARLKIAMQDASDKPDMDVATFMVAVEKRIKDAEAKK